MHQSADGMGLEYDPILIVLKARTHHTHLREDKSSLTLRSSTYDPCGTVPVVKLGAARHVNGESIYTVEAALTLGIFFALFYFSAAPKSPTSFKRWMTRAPIRSQRAPSNGKRSVNVDDNSRSRDFRAKRRAR